jgi:hypothetical protein
MAVVESGRKWAILEGPFQVGTTGRTKPANGPNPTAASRPLGALWRSHASTAGACRARLTAFLRPGRCAAGTAQVRSLDQPDETRSFPNGAVEMVTIADTMIGRARFEAGWRWSNDVKPIAGTDWCMVLHVGYCVSGSAIVRAPRRSLRRDLGQAVTGGLRFWRGPRLRGVLSAAVVDPGLRPRFFSVFPTPANFRSR